VQISKDLLSAQRNPAFFKMGVIRINGGLLIMRHLKLLLVLHIWVYNGSNDIYPSVAGQLSQDGLPPGHTKDEAVHSIL
jgi:hypothetical protein